MVQVAAIKAKIDRIQSGLSDSHATAEDNYQLERLLHQVPPPPPPPRRV